MVLRGLGKMSQLPAYDAQGDGRTPVCGGYLWIASPSGVPEELSPDEDVEERDADMSLCMRRGGMGVLCVGGRG